MGRKAGATDGYGCNWRKDCLCSRDDGHVVTVRDLYTPTCILHAENWVAWCPSVSKEQRLKCFEMGLKWHF